MLEIQSSYGRVSGRWETDVCIVGGGPSALTVDVGFFCGKQVLAVNDSALRLSSSVQAAMLSFFSLDNRWVRQHRDFLSAYDGEKFVALPLETWPDCAGIPGVTYLKWDTAAGLSDGPGTINTGGNSGYGALGIAWLKRARRIFLFGYDMDGEKYQEWIPRFRVAALQLAAWGTEVWNMNPDSKLDAFPKAKISDFKLSPAPGEGKLWGESQGAVLAIPSHQETGFMRR